MNVLIKDSALVVYYYKNNIYSINALIGALETDEYFDDINIFFITKKDKLISGLKDIIKMHKLVIVGISFFTTQLWDIYDLISTLRNRYNDQVIFIAGGPHPTGDPLGVLKLGFDFVYLD